MYNGYKIKNKKIPYDPSYDDASNGVAGKWDDGGAVDFKIIDQELLNKHKVYVQSGPVFDTNKNFEPFNINDYDDDTKKYMIGIPEIFDFKPLYIKTE